MQFFSVPEYAPPPEEYAELPVTTQFVTNELVDAHQTPPPLSSSVVSTEVRVAPFVRVNPLSVALFVM